MSLLQTTSSTRQSDLLRQTTCCPEEHGDSGRTRTPNLLIGSQLLYPVELLRYRWVNLLENHSKISPPSKSFNQLTPFPSIS